MNLFWTIVTSSFGAFALTRLFDFVANHRIAVARLRAMLLDLDKCEELAMEYLKLETPKTPAYRMPITLMKDCLSWFAGAGKLKADEMRALHDVVMAAEEVNRCLDLVHEARTREVPDRGLPPGMLRSMAVNSEVGRANLKCQTVVESAPTVRAFANAALLRLDWWREDA